MNNPAEEARRRTPTFAGALCGVGERLLSRRGGVDIGARSSGAGVRVRSGVPCYGRVLCRCRRRQLRGRAVGAAGQGKSPVPGFAHTRSSHEHHQGCSSCLELVRLP